MPTLSKAVVLQLGLVSCIVNVEALYDKPESLTTLCQGTAAKPHAPAKIAQRRFCTVEKVEVAWGDLVKGRAMGDGWQIVTEADVESVKNSEVGVTKKVLSLLAHNSADVDSHTISGETTYYLVPTDASQTSAYADMLDTVQRHPELAFTGRWTVRTSTSTYRLGDYRGALVIRQLLDPECIKAVPAMTLPAVTDARRKQFDAVLPLIVTDYDPTNYVNSYRVKLAELIDSQAVVTGAPVAPTAKASKAAPAVALVDTGDALARMLAEAEAAKAKPARKPRRKAS